MAYSETRYAASVFLNAAIPLFRVLAEELPAGKSLLKKEGIIQFRTQDGEEALGTHFELKEGEMKTVLGLAENPDIELAFPSLEHFVAFFQGKSKKLPKIKGLGKPGLLIPTFRILLSMASILGQKGCPAKEEDQLQLIKLMYYLLPAGISTLNKMGHPTVKHWSETSPDRVYAWALDGHPEIASYLRVKAGKTKASRGAYTRSQPFFTMRFADPVSALAVLQQTGDMLKLTAERKLIMEGAPEFGGKIGDLMMLVGQYAQG